MQPFNHDIARPLSEHRQTTILKPIPPSSVHEKFPRGVLGPSRIIKNDLPLPHSFGSPTGRYDCQLSPHAIRTQARDL